MSLNGRKTKPTNVIFAESVLNNLEAGRKAYFQIRKDPKATETAKNRAFNRWHELFRRLVSLADNMEALEQLHALPCPLTQNRRLQIKLKRKTHLIRLKEMKEVRENPPRPCIASS